MWENDGVNSQILESYGSRIPGCNEAVAEEDDSVTLSAGY